MNTDFDILGLKSFKSDIQMQLDALTQEIKGGGTPPQPPEYASRIADLEVKMAKLWALLVETTPSNKEKLTKFGKRFGGAAKDRL